MLRRWVAYSIVVIIRGVGTSGAVWIIQAVGGALLAGVGRTLVVAVIVICVVGMVLRTTVLRTTIVWATKDLIWQSNILNTWRIVRRLRIWGEPLALVRREGIRGGVLR